jgi:hypothetical protein
MLNDNNSHLAKASYTFRKDNKDQGERERELQHKARNTDELIANEQMCRGMRKGRMN